MKKYTLTTVCVLALAALCQVPAFAQYTNANGTVWNNPGSAVAESAIQRSIERRRLENRLERNRKKSSKKTTSSGRSKRKTSTKAVKRVASPAKASPAKASPVKASPVKASPVKAAVAPLPHYGIEVRRDSYQDFHREDGNGFKADFTFVSVATGKTIAKSAFCKLYDMDSAIEGIPAGTYNVSVKVPYGGKMYPAHIGSKLGSDENPKGGDFAPSIQIVLKPIIDGGGSRVMGISPEKLYVRVLE